MRGPKPPVVELSPEERQELEGLVRAHRTPQQVARRARIVLAAADGLNNTEIARRLALDADTVRLWRIPWLGVQAVSPEDLSLTERLTGAPKPGAPARITREQICQIVAWASSTRAGSPVSRVASSAHRPTGSDAQCE